MIYQLAAEAVLALHLLFTAFALFGGLAIPVCPRVAWVHVPTVLWGCLVNLAEWVCPLTPLENHFRGLAGEAGYEGDFLERYLLPVQYVEIPGPVLGGLLGVWTAAVYLWAWHRTRAA